MQRTRISTHLVDTIKSRTFADELFANPRTNKGPRTMFGALCETFASDRYYGLVGLSSLLSDAMMMPPMMAASAMIAMIQLVLPSSSL